MNSEVHYHSTTFYKSMDRVFQPNSNCCRSHMDFETASCCSAWHTAATSLSLVKKVLSWNMNNEPWEWGLTATYACRAETGYSSTYAFQETYWHHFGRGRSCFVQANAMFPENNRSKSTFYLLFWGNKKKTSQQASHNITSWLGVVCELGLWRSFYMPQDVLM